MPQSKSPNSASDKRKQGSNLNIGGDVKDNNIVTGDNNSIKQETTIKNESPRSVVITSVLVMLCVGITAVCGLTSLFNNNDSNSSAQPPTNSSDVQPAVPTAASTPKLRTTPMQILFPLYIYPGSPGWQDIVSVNADVPLTVVLNPNSGPGTCPPDANYQKGIQLLQDSGVTVLGYVYTNHGNKSINDVQQQIKQYFDFDCFQGAVDGIFLDSNYASADKLSYYNDIYYFIKSSNSGAKVFINSGVNPDITYYTNSPFDNLVFYEGYPPNWESFQQIDATLKLSSSLNSAIVHTVPDAATMRKYIDMAFQRNVGYIFVTDDIMPNPYDSIPSYWQEEVDYIKSLNDKLATP